MICRRLKTAVSQAYTRNFSMLKLPALRCLLAAEAPPSGHLVDFGCFVVESSLIKDVHSQFTHVIGIDDTFALDRHAFLITFYLPKLNLNRLNLGFHYLHI